MRLILGLICLIRADDEIEIEVEEIDELAISDKDLPFDPNDGFDIDNFQDEGSDPKKLDPTFKLPVTSSSSYLKIYFRALAIFLYF